jgi:hypothetical protein
MTVAYLKEKPAGQGSTPSTPSGMRSATARLLGTGNGSRALSFGSNGSSRAVSGTSRMGGGVGASTSASGSQGVANYDGKGTYIIFNTSDTLFISDLNSPAKVFPFSLSRNQLLPSFFIGGFLISLLTVPGSNKIHPLQQLEPTLPCI